IYMSNTKSLGKSCSHYRQNNRESNWCVERFCRCRLSLRHLVVAETVNITENSRRREYGSPAGESFWNGNVATVEKKRVWWKPASWIEQSRAVRGTSAWFVSFLVHGAMLVLLASITLYIPLRDKISLSIVTHNEAD